MTSGGRFITYRRGPNAVFERLKTLSNSAQDQDIAIFLGGVILADVNVVGVDRSGISTTRELGGMPLNDLQFRQKLALDKGSRTLVHLHTVRQLRLKEEKRQYLILRLLRQ
jgi:hypothetical protein